MSFAAWILILLALLGAAAAGFGLGRLRDTRSKDLERELSEAREALQAYRAEVGRHFEHSGALFAQMAGTYRDLYQHLAHGAQKLTDLPPGQLLPEQTPRLIDPAAPEPAAEQAPPPRAPLDAPEASEESFGDESAPAGTFAAADHTDEPPAGEPQAEKTQAGESADSPRSTVS